MKHLFQTASMLTLVLMGSVVYADDENLNLSHNRQTGVFTLSWTGQPGYTYFILQTDPTADLTSSDWLYWNTIVTGTGEGVSFDFTSNAPQAFFRLRFTNIPTDDPFAADFDGDNIGNWDELLQDTDPFATLDLNSNGIPDDWELFWDDQFGAFPKPMTASLTHRESITKQLYLNNPVAPNADFTVTVSNNLAEAQVVFDYEDSLTGGAVYN